MVTDPAEIAKYAGKDLSELINLPEAIADFDFDAVDSPKPRAFFSHTPWDVIPKGCKIIYIVRNPADIAPSFSKYVKEMAVFDGYDKNDAAQFLIEGRFPVCAQTQTHTHTHTHSHHTHTEHTNIHTRAYAHAYITHDHTHTHVRTRALRQ